MGIEAEVKKVGRSKVFIFVVGILVGGTILAYPVAMAVGFIRSKISFLRSGADNAAALAAGK